jgi:hypothetical protein
MKTFDLELRAFKHTVESTEDVQALFEQLDDLSGTALKELHNSVHTALGNPEKAVKKFSDKKTAIRRTNLALDDLERTIAEESGDDAGGDGEPNTAPEAEEQADDQGGLPEKDVSEVDQEATPKAGRKSKHANARLVCRDASWNPHRQGTKSFDAYEMIRNNPGITYQEAIDAGARRNTLNFDLRLGHIIYQERH